LLRGLVADLSGVDRQVQDALEQGARAHAAGYLHRLRGAAANLGAIDLADRAQALEHAIQAQSPEVIDRMVEFTGCLETLLQAIQAWLAGSEPAQAGPATPPGAAAPLDAAKLAELRHALATHRPRPARRLFAELEASLIQAYGPVAIQTLTEAMTAWRYDEAIEVLDALSTDGGQGAPL
jgi:HPt (histidine-containing phosphotransfer) domain-containing protein